MKKFLVCILSICIIASAIPFAACSNRAEILKVYNAGEYMDDDVIKDFSAWYKNETGKNIKVEYKTYSTNEDMYTEVYARHADYDVVLGSDYIISRMIKNDLLLPIDTDLVYGGLKEDEVISQKIFGFVNDYENYTGDENYTAETRYSMPYMWGTFGIMFRKDLTDFDWQDMTWDSLFKEGNYSGKRYMKNSIRDAYAAASIVGNADALKSASADYTAYGAEYASLLKKVINDTSAANMTLVENTLKTQKKYLFAYESDDGKDDMVQQNPQAYYGLFWSCDAGYAMEDCTDLYYGVPKEGSNVWVDSFVLPKYGKNSEAGQYFLKYLCQYDQAYLNRNYAGCSSPIEEVFNNTKEIIETAWAVVKGEITEYDESDEDIAYYIEFFTDTEDDFGDMFISMLFPSDEILSRCAVMIDTTEEASRAMTQMWTRVKA